MRGEGQNRDAVSPVDHAARKYLSQIEALYDAWPGNILITVPTPWNGLEEPQAQWDGGPIARVSGEFLRTMNPRIPIPLLSKAEWLIRDPWTDTWYVFLRDAA